MLWPWVLPFQITCIMLTTIVIVLTMVAPRLRWSRVKTSLNSAIVACLLFVPSCTVLQVVVARDYGMTIAVHAHGTEGMKRAVLAGVDSIEHGTFMTDEVMELMKERGTWWVPTNMAGEWVAMKAEEPGYFPEIVRPKAAAIGPAIRDTFRRANKAGVKIAFGTDSGVSVHGENAHEFELMVEGGMSPMKAIQTATLSASQLLRVEDRLGTLEKGKIADIVAVNGNPLDDISVMKQVVFVMKDGTVFRQP